MDPLALELARRTLAEAISALAGTGSLPPLIVVRKNGEDSIERLPPVPDDQAATAARIYASARSDADASAFAVTGPIEFQGATFEGIIVESWNFGGGAGARLGLRFERGQPGGTSRTIGRTLHRGPQGWFEPEVPSLSVSERDERLAANPLGTHMLLLALNELMMHGSPVTPFALVQKDGARERVTMTDDRLEDAVASVHAYALSRTDADFVAYVVDGYVPLDGKRTDAIVIDVWHYASKLSFRVAQPYAFVPGRKEPGILGRAVTQLNDGAWVPSGRMELDGEVMFGA